MQAVQARQEAARGARRKNVCELHWRAVGHTHGAAADLQLRLPPRFPRNSPFFVVSTRNNDLSVLPLSTHRELSEKTKLLLLQAGGGYRQKVPCLTPNSFVMVNYKTFHLKHHLAFVKILPSNRPNYFLSLFILFYEGKMAKISPKINKIEIWLNRAQK